MVQTRDIDVGSDAGLRHLAQLLWRTLWTALWPVRRILRGAAHYLIRAYQLTFSSLLGRHCRYLPTCSAYMDEAIARHGLWAGGIMGVARLCRCHPWGNYGFDPVPGTLPAGSSWRRPWRYGDWRGPLHCAPVTPPKDA